MVTAYNYTCALTGYRLVTLTSGTIVDACHIHQFAHSRNNDPTNGIALCKNAHWLFDNGLWSLSDDYILNTSDDFIAIGIVLEQKLWDVYRLHRWEPVCGSQWEPFITYRNDIAFSNTIVVGSVVSAGVSFKFQEQLKNQISGLPVKMENKNGKQRDQSNRSRQI